MRCPGGIVKKMSVLMNVNAKQNYPRRISIMANPPS